MNYCVVIPAYMPDEKLTSLCEALLGEEDRPFVVVVDDGSSKEAHAALFAQLEAMGAVVLHHDVNRGKGAAVKTGFKYVMENLPGTMVVTADADGQHTPEDVLRIAEATANNPNTLVLGGRDFSQMPPRSCIGNTITRFFFRLGTGLSISDTQTGLRGYSFDMLSRLIVLDGERYEFEMNELLKLHELGMKCIEVPIATIYIDNNASTHFHALRDGVMVFSKVLKYCAASILSAVLDFGLYWLLLMWLPVEYAYIGARVVSGVFNYECNRRTVFNSRATAANFAGYAALCACSMLLGSVCVTMLTRSAQFLPVLAKLIVDSLLFVVNYNVQKYVIFREKKKA